MQSDERTGSDVFSINNSLEGEVEKSWTEWEQVSTTTVMQLRRFATPDQCTTNYRRVPQGQWVHPGTKECRVAPRNKELMANRANERLNTTIWRQFAELTLKTK